METPDPPNDTLKRGLKTGEFDTPADIFEGFLGSVGIKKISKEMK